jgi:hypothetical protein
MTLPGSGGDDTVYLQPPQVWIPEVENRNAGSQTRNDTRVHGNPQMIFFAPLR